MNLIELAFVTIIFNLKYMISKIMLKELITNGIISTT